MLGYRPTGLIIPRGGSTSDFQLATNEHVLGPNFSDGQLAHNQTGWDSAGSAPPPPSGDAHAYFDQWAGSSYVVAAMSLRTDDEIYESWPVGMARSLTGPYMTVDPVYDGARQRNSEAAWTATGREVGFAGMSMDSGRQLRVLPGAMTYNGDGPAGPVRSLSIMWEFRLGRTFEVGHKAQRDVDDPLLGGSGWNGTYKFWTLFSGLFRSGKLMELQTSVRGSYGAEYAQTAALRYYGMTPGNPAINEIIEPNVNNISPIRIQRPEDPDNDMQPSDRTRQYMGERSGQTYADHVAMQQGNVQKPFLITREEWHWACYHIKYFNQRQVGLSLYMSSERTPPVRIFGTREPGGGPMIFDSSIHPGDVGLPWSPAEFRWECNSSESGNHANTIWTPNDIWGRNLVIRASQLEDDFIPATWQPIGLAA